MTQYTIIWLIYKKYCIVYNNITYNASLVAQTVKNLPAMQETWI